jgi:hypothetical protein
MNDHATKKTSKRNASKTNNLDKRIKRIVCAAIRADRKRIGTALIEAAQIRREHFGKGDTIGAVLAVVGNEILC